MCEIVDGVYTANATPTMGNPPDRCQYFMYLRDGEYARFRALAEPEAPGDEL